MANKKIDTGPDCELGNVPSQPGEVRDAVFGNVGEEGPNFRNVSKVSSPRLLSSRLTPESGWLVRNGCSHDEDPNWPWSPFDP